MNRLECIDLFELCASVEANSVDMILCDLPYGVTQNKWDSVIPMPEMWEAFKRVIKPRGAIVLTATQPFASDLIQSNRAQFRYEWIWVKNRSTGFLNANRRPMPMHEQILVFSAQATLYYPQLGTTEAREINKGKHKNNTTNYGDFVPISKLTDITYPTSVLDFGYDSDLTVTRKHNPLKPISHPTQKPLSLWQYLIKTYTQEGDTVLDPTVGSGTTAVACHLLNRRYICGDTNPEYVEVAKQRLSNCDPLQHKVLSNGAKQISLFGGVNG